MKVVFANNDRADSRKINMHIDQVDLREIRPIS